MPTKTFFNLSKPKQNRIFEATKSVILQHPVNKITISMIVRQARIPRGSFYQYFNGIEDLLKYVYQSFIESFEAHVKSRIMHHEQDVFAFFVTAFDQDYAFFTTTQFTDVYEKLMRERQFVGLDIAVHQQARIAFFNRMLDLLDTTRINHLSREDQLKIYTLYVQLKNQYMHRAMHLEQSYESAKSDYLFYIRIIEKGVMIDEKHI